MGVSFAPYSLLGVSGRFASSFFCFYSRMLCNFSFSFSQYFFKSRLWSYSTLISDLFSWVSTFGSSFLGYSLRLTTICSCLMTILSASAICYNFFSLWPLPIGSGILSLALMTNFFDGFFSSRTRGSLLAGTSMGKGLMGCSCSFFIWNLFLVLGEYFSLLTSLLISGAWQLSSMQLSPSLKSWNSFLYSACSGFFSRVGRRLGLLCSNSLFLEQSSRSMPLFLRLTTFLLLKVELLPSLLISADALDMQEVALNWLLKGRLLILNFSTFLQVSTKFSSSFSFSRRYSREKCLMSLPVSSEALIWEMMETTFQMLGQRLDCSLEKMRMPLTFTSKAPCLGKATISFFCQSKYLWSPRDMAEMLFLCTQCSGGSLREMCVPLKRVLTLASSLSQNSWYLASLWREHQLCRWQSMQCSTQICMKDPIILLMQLTRHSSIRSARPMSARKWLRE